MQARRLAAAAGSPETEAVAFNALAVAAWLRADVDAVQNHARTAITLARRYRLGLLLPAALVLIASAAALRGDRAGMESWLAEAEPLVRGQPTEEIAVHAHCRRCVPCFATSSTSPRSSWRARARSRWPCDRRCCRRWSRWTFCCALCTVRIPVRSTGFAVGRMALEQGINLPMQRVRFVNDGEEIDVGDRTLRAVLPPIFDNPTTRGLLDPRTGFFWAADCFGAPVDGMLPDANDVAAPEWRDGFLTLHRMLAPWHTMLDHHRFARLVDRVEELPITVAVGAHGPAVHGPRLADAFRMLRELPHTGPLAPFTQTDLEGWLTPPRPPRHEGPGHAPDQEPSPPKTPARTPPARNFGTDVERTAAHRPSSLLLTTAIQDHGRVGETVERNSSERRTRPRCANNDGGAR